MRERIGPPVAFHASGAHDRCVALRRRVPRKASVARAAGRSTAPVIVFGSSSSDERPEAVTGAVGRPAARAAGAFFFQFLIAVPLRTDIGLI